MATLTSDPCELTESPSNSDFGDRGEAVQPVSSAQVHSLPVSTSQTQEEMNDAEALTLTITLT